MDSLIELSKSPNETTRLAAIREILDRLLGKPAVFVDSVTAKVDIGSLYLQALQRVNSKAADAVEAKPTEVQAGS
jgi:hypothetical protein